jgi:hypothetical protein
MKERSQPFKFFLLLLLYATGGVIAVFILLVVFTGGYTIATNFGRMAFLIGMVASVLYLFVSQLFRGQVEIK